MWMLDGLVAKWPQLTPSMYLGIWSCGSAGLGSTRRPGVRSAAERAGVDLVSTVSKLSQDSYAVTCKGQHPVQPPVPFRPACRKCIIKHGECMPTVTHGFACQEQGLAVEYDRCFDLLILMAWHPVGGVVSRTTHTRMCSTASLQNPQPGKCWLVGSGPGSTEHLTVSYSTDNDSLRLLGSAKWSSTPADKILNQLWIRGSAF